jgi:DNA-binding response OmpR family regulator
VLLVEDDAAMARLLRHVLELDGYAHVRHAWNGEQALDLAGEADIILLDQQLPDVRGLDLLPRLLDRQRAPSVIMITAFGSESLAARALRQGAEDYLTKDHTLPELIPRVVERVRRNRALQTALVRAEKELLRAERMAAVGELSVTLHHQLNNPLMAALAEVELALGDSRLPGEHREGLETAKTALLRIRDILRQSARLRRASSTDYLEGLRMIDLGDSGDHSPQSYRGRAVMHLADDRAVRVLALLLRHAGFEVERAVSAADARTAADKVGVSLVVLGSGPDLPDPLERFPASTERGYAVVVFSADGGVAAAGADLSLPLPFDPATVVDELLQAVERRG